MHLVHLIVSTGLGGIYIQHDTVPSPTPVKPLTGDPLHHTPHLEAGWRIYNWYWVLGKLRYISIDLPGSLGLFIHIKEALCHVKDRRLTLNKGVHQALEYFGWLMQNLERRLTHIYELVPLQPTLDGYHDVSGYMCGGINPPRPHRSTPDTASANQH